MTSVMVKMETFQLWKQKRNSYIKVFENARKELLNNIDIVSQAEANEVANMLNQIVTDVSFSESKITSKILNKMPRIINATGEKALSQVEISNKQPFKVISAESADAWSSYYKEYNRLQKEQKLTKAELEKNIGLQDLKRYALSKQGALNTIQGDVFESFLQEIGPILQGHIRELAEGEAQNIVKDLEKSINNKTILTTLGGQYKKLSFNFGEELITISSKQKVDTIIPAPFFSADQDWLISAKNYAKLQNISLVSKASLLGLVEGWPMSQQAKNFFLNSLTIYNPTPNDIWQRGKVLFAIQSLVGVMGAEKLANILIVNIRNSSRPIRVISTGVLLQTLNEETLKDMFIVKYAPELPLFKNNDDPRTKEKFQQRIKSVTINTKLQKQLLYLNYLKKLS